MRQRVGIAQAIAGEPELLIVDEPTAGLDPEERARFYRLLSELAETRTVLLSTHIVDDVAVLCSNFAVIRNGRLLATTTPAEAKATIADTMYEGVVGRHDLDAFAATFQVTKAYLVEGVHALSPTFAMSGFFVYPFFAALMAGLSVMRDDEAGLSELLQSTPLTRAEYVWAKCAGVSCAMMIAMLAPHPRQLSALRPTMTRPPATAAAPRSVRP